MKTNTTRTMEIAHLKPADYNPREISEEALVGLGNSMERFGIVQPIVWNERSGNVVGGHQRLKVLEKKGVATTEVVVVDLPEIEEKALNLALNNPAIAGDFTDNLQAIIGEIKIEAPELSDLLILSELEDLTFSGGGGPGGGEGSGSGSSRRLVLPRELWGLGHHRIQCGEAFTDEVDEIIKKWEELTGKTAVLLDEDFG